MVNKVLEGITGGHPFPRLKASFWITQNQGTVVSAMSVAGPHSVPLNKVLFNKFVREYSSLFGRRSHPSRMWLMALPQVMAKHSRIQAKAVLKMGLCVQPAATPSIASMIVPVPTITANSLAR
jgi:hypothetical protein